MATAKIQRTYNVPLRKEWLKVPKYKRAKKAVTGLKIFLTRHMKCENLIIGKHLNEAIWKHGIKNPPHHIKVDVLKEDDLVVAELSGKPLPEIKKGEKKKGVVGKVLDKIKGAPKEEKPEVVAAEKKETPGKSEPKDNKKAEQTEVK